MCWVILKTDSCSYTQEDLRYLWNPNAHHSVHKSPPLTAILNQMNAISILHVFIFKIHFGISLLLTSSPSKCLFLAGVLTKMLYALCAMFPTDLIH
jgi:hypothetical protein